MTFVAIRFATSTLALTGETVSTLPEMYHEISAALSVSGWTLMRTRIPRKSPNQSFDTRLCFHIDFAFIFDAFSSFASAGICRAAPLRRLIFWTSTGV
jgi:hypothetical protein